MQADLEPPKKPEDDGLGTVTLMLGLYLIILAFFILLNALAEENEEKRKQVEQSLATGFGFHMSGAQQSTQDIDALDNPVFDRVVREIESVMQSFISMRHYRISSVADQMIITLKTPDLFMPGSVRIQPTMADLFRDLGRVLAAKRAGTHVESQIVVSSTDMDGGPSRLSAEELSGRRAALFVRALVERGVDPRYISAAIHDQKYPEVKIFVDVVVHDKKAAKRGLDG